jgi:hydrogenase maturation factor
MRFIKEFYPGNCPFFAQVLSITYDPVQKDLVGWVQCGGRKSRISFSFIPEIQVDDWVIVQFGFAKTKVDFAKFSAYEILLLKELATFLHEGPWIEAEACCYGSFSLDPLPPLFFCLVFLIFLFFKLEIYFESVAWAQVMDDPIDGAIEKHSKDSNKPPGSIPTISLPEVTVSAQTVSSEPTILPTSRQISSYGPEMNILEIPRDIRPVSQEEMQTVMALTVNDLAAFSPSINPTQATGNIVSEPIIRGLPGTVFRNGMLVGFSSGG